MSTDLSPLKTIAIIQARMSSSRLPGKVLLDIAGQPMLAHVVERTRRAQRVHQVVVATTSDPSDDPIQAFCEAHGCAFWRGSLHDVLDRYYQAACHFHAEAIVRITADCPLIDPQVVDHTVAALFGGGKTPAWDFAANRLPPPWRRSYPIGLDTEVCTFAALEQAWQNAQEPHQREHVLPYLYQHSPVFDSLASPTPPPADSLAPGQFRVLLVNHIPDHGALRWTVDTPADLELVRQIFARLPGKPFFTWLDVLALFEKEPALAEINASIVHKTAFDVDHRLTPTPK